MRFSVRMVPEIPQQFWEAILLRDALFPPRYRRGVLSRGTAIGALLPSPADRVRHVKVLCMHAAGLGDLVAVSLSADLDSRVLYADDSAVLISTKAPAVRLGRLTYVKNAFVVLGSVPRRRELRQAVETISRALARWQLPRSRRPFRLMFSEDGQLASVPSVSRSGLEAAVTRATGGRFTPRGGGDEYWTISRRDLSEVLFCRRAARPQRQQPPRGGLAPDVAHVIVNALGRPQSRDVVLDPFAGSGALIAARVQTPFREAICSDLGYGDGSAEIRPGIADNPKIRKLADDARTLASIPDHSIDAVVTDPPWGEFDEDPGLAESLIAAALGAIHRVMRPGGKVAMLVARRLAADVGKQWLDNDFRIRKSYDLLVNGHPATLLVGDASRTDSPTAR